jgi:hypothetical protein
MFEPGFIGLLGLSEPGFIGLLGLLGFVGNG